MNRRHAHGLTLIETMIAVAIVAVMASLAIPSVGAQLDRGRLRAAAEHLASGLAEARLQAAQRGVVQHVGLEPGAPWCLSVAERADCGCAPRPDCPAPRIDGREHPGIELAAPARLQFQPVDGTALASTGVTLLSPRGQQLRVEVSRLGRTRMCAPQGGVTGLPAC